MALSRNRRDAKHLGSFTGTSNIWERGRVLLHWRGLPFSALRLRRRGSTRAKVQVYPRIEASLRWKRWTQTAERAAWANREQAETAVVMAAWAACAPVTKPQL